MLSTVQGIAHQTLHATKTKEEAAQSIEDRIMALARAHRLLTDENWKTAPLQTIVNSALEPFRQRTGRFAISGSDKVQINPKVALAITMAMNELATNATKYGALSVPAGHVKIDWVMEGNQRAIITWTESEGPPVILPTRQGFGSILFSRGLAGELGSDVTVHYQPGGVVCINALPRRSCGLGNFKFARRGTRSCSAQGLCWLNVLECGAHLFSNWH
jgi:two-component sensor histidine kinase